MGHHDRTFNTAALADAEHGMVVLGCSDVAFDVAVHVAAARELDVAMDASFRSDQGSNRGLATRFLTQHACSGFVQPAIAGHSNVWLIRSARASFGQISTIMRCGAKPAGSANSASRP